MSYMNAADYITVNVTPSATAEPIQALQRKGVTIADVLEAVGVTPGKATILLDGDVVDDLSTELTEDCDITCQPKSYKSGNSGC
ncbi:hypothetical protein B5F76_08440 [Desulfovibrio sp. An276]|uniref:hypothetical protein n=1 Tax=Desulfovibrio sp. An276 TaxID=1965618 RepID=UPI000B3A5FD2|nr:hypothetical protein [Desulfovibrio sp. An276]OUO52032.1 hypothetical protein B5F76_08440 [Desulfovibrio sp. An276]